MICNIKKAEKTGKYFQKSMCIDENSVGVFSEERCLCKQI